jgi:hypothetical protein
MDDRRNVFLNLALAEIPKILTLLDRNRHSPTYGCFDRNYWHYRIIDFPSGMAQEFVWPLALVYNLDAPGNSYYQQPVLRDWALAGMRFAAASAHNDGSCDDYFPYEKAGGAAAFSLLAFIESYTLLQLDDPKLLNFFSLRARWLSRHHESGKLSNHQALIALCLLRLNLLTGDVSWRELALQRLRKVLSWQTAEGWFPEYEGCDPGYLTLTISLLGALYDIEPLPELRASLIKAVSVAREFLHPDGSFGGEYGSRNTLNFFPHGFELIGRWLPEALHVNDGYIKGLNASLQPCYSDDHVLGHHAWNYLLAWRDFQSMRPEMPARTQGRILLQQAGILIDRTGTTELYLALNKGGAFKLFRDGHLQHSDTGVSLRVRQGRKLKTAVSHLVDNYTIDVLADRISIRGNFGWAKQMGMTTFNLLALRIIMQLGGRLFPDLIRKILQMLLITSKKPSPFQFERILTRTPSGWRVTDKVFGKSWRAVEDVGIGPDQTSIYVVMSRIFQAGQLRPWQNFTQQIRSLKLGEPLIIERDL